MYKYVPTIWGKELQNEETHLILLKINIMSKQYKKKNPKKIVFLGLKHRPSNQRILLN